MGNLSAVFPVVHHEKVKVGDVVDDELVEAVRQEVPSEAVRAIAARKGAIVKVLLDRTKPKYVAYPILTSLTPQPLKRRRKRESIPRGLLQDMGTFTHRVLW